MQNVLKINWKDYVTNAQSYSKTKWLPDVTEHFLDHLLPVLASIPLQKEPEGSKAAGKISATETMKQMPEMIETPNGSISGNAVKCILGFLYYIPRGKLMKVSMTKAPRLAALTPLPMYAQKLHNNVNYSSWNPKDPMLKWFIGRSLEPIANMHTHGVIVPHLTREDILKHRKLALTHQSGNKIGQMASLTDYKCIIDHFDISMDEDDERENGGIERFPMPKIAITMLLQTWLANVSLRDESSMILQPYNWDLPPTPWDSTTAGIATAEELPWM